MNDTMTPAELDKAWAELLEYFPVQANFRPSSDWQHWGMCYEWMRGSGWKAAHREEDDVIMWDWIKEGRMFAAEDPDFRRAMLLAGYEAEGKGEWRWKYTK